MNYYDLVLAIIPLALVFLTATLLVGGIVLATAVSLSATVSAGVIGHAMFVNPPADTQTGQR